METAVGVIGRILLVVALLSCLTGFLALIPLLIPEFRKRGAIALAVSLALFVISFAIDTGTTNWYARTLGYLDASDRREARAAGYTSPTEWREQKPRLEVQRRQRERDAARAEELRKADAARAEELRKAEEASRCRSDLSCWAKKYVDQAHLSCSAPVQRLALINSRWTDGMFEKRFPYARWKDKNAAIVTFAGDTLEMQNGLGAWVRHTYECDLDPVGERVLGVRAAIGKLPG